MRLKIQNIGMIENADIKLDGLTVIAGENDTGKSTIGKVLFCITKALGISKNGFAETNEFKIKDILEHLYFDIRKYAKITDDKELDTLKEFSSMNLYRGHKDSTLYIKKLLNYILKLNLDNNTTSDLHDIIDNLAIVINEPDNECHYLQNTLNKVFRAEFDSNILKYNCQNAKIELYEDKLILLDILVDSNNKITISSNYQPIYLDDATFIETPLILNNHDLLSRSTSGLNTTKSISLKIGMPYTTLHTKDLFDKLKEINYFSNSDGKISKIISRLISGELIYVNDDKDFKYIKNDNKLSIKNTATGIKSFGIIQLLVENGFINKKSFLILDEPEIHLHPKWQLEYAKLIALLVQNNIPVLVTSHSPYMIEALQKFNKNAENNNFYLAQNEKIYQVEDSNPKTLAKIFEKLSEPFEVFDEMDSDDF